jgi:uncharacterized membrane protein YqjE
MKERPDINTSCFSGLRVDREGKTHADGRSLSQILQDIVNHVSNIIRSEVRLVQTEVRQDLTHYVKASSLVGIAGALVFYAVGFLLLSAVYALQSVISPWLSALLVAMGVGVAAAILYLIGRKKLTQASLRPDKTIQSLEENVKWFKRQTK